MRKIIVILCRQIHNHQLKSNDKAMSPFLIFTIVLTIGYVLYYAALITMDLHVKPKDGASAEENIVVGENADDQDEYKPKAVVENTETGGFGFLEEKDDSVSPEDNIEEEPSVQEEVLSSVEEDGQPQEKEEEYVSEESGEREEEKTKEEDEIPVLEYKADETHTDKESEPFDESEAFDPELSQPKYGVSTIVEPQVSEKLVQQIEKVNADNTNIQLKGNVISSFDLAEIIRKKKDENCNIDFKDEITKYYPNSG